MKKKVGIITFHASHNYGSMLQAYALQKKVERMGFYCEIINFRTVRQKEFYKPIWKHGSFYNRIKRFVLLLLYIKQIYKKYNLFERFLKEELQLSAKEYCTLDELYKENFNYDYFISGSDQIWNTLILDFDWAYFLPFVKDAKKIAYAPSMGPSPELTMPENLYKIKSLLKMYDAVSVREQRTSLYFSDNFGMKYPVVIDPTLLLKPKDWEDLADSTPLIYGDYCFCYSPWMNEKVLELAFTWANKNNIKVVVSKPFTYLSTMIKWRKSCMYISVGPKEFLNLCKYAKMVCCDSFHAVVFSIYFKTPFLTYNGMDDARISNLLSLTGLTNRSVNHSSDIEDNGIDFDLALNKISSMRSISDDWLRTALKCD